MDRREADNIDRVFPSENENRIDFRDQRRLDDLDDLDSLDDEFDSRYRH